MKHMHSYIDEIRAVDAHVHSMHLRDDEGGLEPSRPRWMPFSFLGCSLKPAWEERGGGAAGADCRRMQGEKADSSSISAPLRFVELSIPSLLCFILQLHTILDTLYRPHLLSSDIFSRPSSRPNLPLTAALQLAHAACSPVARSQCVRVMRAGVSTNAK